MKTVFLVAAVIVLLGACSAPMFVTDAEVVKITTKTPGHFELPARFALVRTVYGYQHAATSEEQELWADVADRFAALGQFSPLIVGSPVRRFGAGRQLIEAARVQRYNYLLLVAIDPATGTADVSLFHVGSGGVMATARATVPEGGRIGFWGGRINNPNRLARVSERIARASISTVEELLRGVVERHPSKTTAG